MLMFGNTMFSKDFTKSVMNEPSAVEATKFYADMVNAHKMAQPTAATDNRGEAEKLWMAGKAAMQLNGPWMLPTIKTQAPNLKYGVGIVPAKKGLPKLSLISGWDWAISSKTKSADAAWDLIKFFNEPKNQASMTNTFPARLSAFKDPRFADPELQPWLESAKISYPNPATPAFPKTGLVIQRIVPAVISGKMTPEAAMAEAHAEAEKVLKEYA
jgi:multiple sugar transport system substrate-binding protein